jgi:hypothetical protein
MKTVKAKPQTPEAEKEYVEFMKRYKAHAEAANRVALTILVWGPSPDRTCPAARKRKKIKEALKEKGHNALFSEDIKLKSVDLLDMSQKSKEHAQAKAADLIIVLVEDSKGALAEFHDFCGDPQIAPKMFVLVPRRFRKGYSASGALRDLADAHGGVFWYGDDDLKRCKVCAKAIQRAQALRLIRAQAGSFQ